MAAIATCQPPSALSALSSLGLLGVRRSSRHQPSVAVRRRRAAATLVALAALGVLLGVGSLAGAEQAPTPSPARYAGDPVPVVAATYLVQPGDTLWTLGRRLQPEGDVRPLVARLLAVHGAGPLVPGERLSLAV